MRLRKGELVDHLYFGTGAVVKDGGWYYVIEFENHGRKKILSGHSTLRGDQDESWTVEQKEAAEKDIKRESKKGQIGEKAAGWRIYPDQS